jgi:hypothetical protein
VPILANALPKFEPRGLCPTVEGGRTISAGGWLSGAVFDAILLVNMVVGARDERTARRIGSDSRQPGGPEVLELGEASTVEATDQHKPSSASATDALCTTRRTSIRVTISAECVGSRRRRS